MGAYNIVGATSLVGGQPEDVGQVLANLQAIQTVINGGLDDSNLSAGAAIAIAKLAGYPTDATKFLRGDATWAVPVTIPGNDTITKAILKQAGNTSPLQGKRVEAGRVTGITLPASGSGSLDQAIVFTAAFGAVPAVTVAIDSAGAAPDVDALVVQPLIIASSTTGVTVRLTRTNNSSYTGVVLNWIAVGT